MGRRINDVSITPEPNCLTLIPPTYSIGVSDQVRQWLSGSHTNNGFIIAGPILNFPSNLPQDNNGNVTARKYKLNTPMVRRVLAPGEEPVRATRKPKRKQ